MFCIHIYFFFLPFYRIHLVLFEFVAQVEYLYQENIAKFFLRLFNFQTLSKDYYFQSHQHMFSLVFQFSHQLFELLIFSSMELSLTLDYLIFQIHYIYLLTRFLVYFDFDHLPKSHPLHNLAKSCLKCLLNFLKVLESKASHRDL